MEKLEIKKFIEHFMKTYGEDTFVPNKNGQFVYYSEDKTSGLNLVCFFEDLLEEYINSVSQQNTKTELPNNCNIPVVSNAVCERKWHYKCFESNEICNTKACGNNHKTN